MSFEIIKENFSIEEIIGNGNTQNLFETEVYLNVPFEEIEKIIWVEGSVVIENTMIVKDKILVNGNIKYNILTKDKEEVLHTLESSKDFNEEINIHGIKESMDAQVVGKIEYIEHELEENKIAIKTLINLEGQVENLKEMEVIETIEHKKDLEILEESLNYRQSYGRDRSTISIEESFNIDRSKPVVEEVLKFFVSPEELESTVIDDRIILSGEAVVTLIIAAGDETYSIKENIPFNHFLEVPGAIEGSKSKVNLNLQEAGYEILKDEEDEMRRVDLNIKIEANGSVYREDSKELLIDAYSIKEELDIEKEEMVLLEQIDEITHDEEISLEIPINAIDVLDIRKEHSIIEKRYENKSIIIEGIVDLDIYYIDRIEREISSFKMESPYKVEVPYDGELEDYILEIEETVSSPRFAIKRENISLDTSIFFQISLKREKTIFAITDILSTGNIIDKKSKPSIIVYIVQKGDVLWDIAKRYNTTTEDILSSNGFSKDYELKVADKIIIEKNINLNF